MSSTSSSTSSHSSSSSCSASSRSSSSSCSTSSQSTHSSSAAQHSGSPASAAKGSLSKDMSSLGHSLASDRQTLSGTKTQSTSAQSHGKTHTAGQTHATSHTTGKTHTAGHTTGKAHASGHTTGKANASGKPHSTKNARSAAQAGRVGDWIKQATSILSAAGVPASKMNASDIAKIIQHESSGNPNAVNHWDSNAKAGHPSIGLMQTIQSTFNAHALPGHNNIRNPVDNIIAGVRYSIARYGSVSNVPGVRAVNQGHKYRGY